MGRFKKALLGAAVAVVATAGFVPAQAYVISNVAPFALVNLGNSTTVGYVGAAPSTGMNGTTITTSGSTTGLYAGNGTTFTSPFGIGSTQEYYGIQPGGSVTFAFTASRTSYSLLIGTIDSFNSLTFTATGSSGTQVISGTDITTAIGGSANGTQTRYLTISALNPFTSLTFSDSTASAFEFVPAAVPEPMTLGLLGAGLIGMGVLRRRSAK